MRGFGGKGREIEGNILFEVSIFEGSRRIERIFCHCYWPTSERFSFIDFLERESFTEEMN